MAKIPVTKTGQSGKGAKGASGPAPRPSTVAVAPPAAKRAAKAKAKVGAKGGAQAAPAPAVKRGRPSNEVIVQEYGDLGGGDGLTARQRRVLEEIRDSVERRGYPPSMREIGIAVGLTSPSSVAHQLAALERKGFLRRDPNRPRAIEVRHPDAGPATGPVAQHQEIDFAQLAQPVQPALVSSLRLRSQICRADDAPPPREQRADHRE